MNLSCPGANPNSAAKADLLVRTASGSSLTPAPRLKESNGGRETPAARPKPCLVVTSTSLIGSRSGSSHPSPLHEWRHVHVVFVLDRPARTVRHRVAVTVAVCRRRGCGRRARHVGGLWRRLVSTLGL